MQKKIKEHISAPNFHSHPNKERSEERAQLPRNSAKGFTLLEILLVIGIIAVLAVVIFVALDPGKRFKDARNARRVTDAENILNAVHQYVLDNKGDFPSGLTEDSERMLGTYGASCDYYNGGCSVEVGACLDLREDLAKYLKTIPEDPQIGIEQETFYSIYRDSEGIVTVRACAAEDTEISVSR
jgi:prepilin-type N-terminal cleavage/methylation domain-containing protein